MSTCRPAIGFRRLTLQHIYAPTIVLPQYVNLSTCHLHYKADHYPNMLTCRPVIGIKMLSHYPKDSLSFSISICQRVDLSPTPEDWLISKCDPFMVLPQTQYVNLLTCHLHQMVITLLNRFCTMLYLNMAICWHVLLSMYTVDGVICPTVKQNINLSTCHHLYKVDSLWWWP